MPDTNFHAFARQRAETLLADLVTGNADATLAQLDALRADVEARIGGLHETLARQDYQAGLEQLVQDLSDAAKHEAETLLEAARAEAERQADAAREEADSRLADARAQATAQAEALQTVNVALLATVDEAREQLRLARAAAQEEAETARKAFETRLAQAQAEHAALERSLAESQRELSTARSERDARAVSATQAKQQIAKLEQEQKRLRQAYEESGQLVDVQIRRVRELSESLETAKADASLARVDADARRHDLEVATARISALENERKKVDAATEGYRRAAHGREDDLVPLLDGVVGALQAIRRASSADEVIDILIEQLSAHFDKAAIFLAVPNGVKGLRGRGFGEDANLGAVVIPSASRSPVIRAMVDRRPIRVEGGDAPDIGLSRGPIARAIALPVLSGDRVIAVAYAEDVEKSTRLSPGIDCKIAEILIDHASRRLTTKNQPSKPVPEASGRTKGHKPAASPSEQPMASLAGHGR